MSFLDNLESTLKNLERTDERTVRRDPKQAARDRNQAQAVAPFAEELKKGPFANDFLTHAVRIAHSSRIKVSPLWMGNTLRVEARERRLELRPTADGILAVFIEDGEELSSEVIDLKQTKAEEFAERWLA